MTLVLAFVPVDDVIRVFNLLPDEVDEDLLGVIDYFEVYYVVGRRTIARRRSATKYPPQPALWNQHEAALTGSHKTNSIGEE